jgi:hypothetical protein
LRNCDCGPSKFDFRNSATLHSLLPVPLLSSPFSSAQNGLKNQPKIFLELSVSLETKNLPFTFYLQFFFLHELTGFHGQKYAKVLEVKLSSCGLQKKLRLQNSVAEQHFF